MQAADVTFPSTIGHLVDTFRIYLPARGIPDVTVQPKLPTRKTARMVTVSDDGGPSADGILRRRHRINVWAATPTDAENLAIVVADCMRSRLRMRDVVGPVEVTDSDDDAITVAGHPLTHHLLSGVLLVRARNL